MKRPSAIVVNHKDDVFVKDDIAVYAFSAQGKLMRTIAKGKLGHPFGKLKNKSHRIGLLKKVFKCYVIILPQDPT